MLRVLALVFAWFAAHPAEALLLAYVALSGVNGLLPARVRTGPVGAALHVALDRISALTRSDSAGTLKWPFIVSTVIVGRPLARDVVDVSGPAIDDVRDRPTVAPGEITRPHRPPPGLGPLGQLLVVWALVAIAGCASTSAGSAAAATGEALSVVREVRERVCAPEVDLLVGPLQSRPCHCPLAGSGGAAAPPADDAGMPRPADPPDATTQAPDAGDGQ